MTHIIHAAIRAGIWEADIPGTADRQPNLTVVHGGKPLSQMQLAYDTDRAVWRVSCPIPAALINDGLQSFAVMDAQGQTIHHFTLQAGHQLGDDLSAEVALLRNELELLKTAFRRHCAEG